MSSKVGESGIQVVRSLVEEETPRTRSDNEERVHELFNGYVPDHDDYSICKGLGIRMSDLTGGTPDAKTSPSPSKNSDSPLDSDPDYDALEDSLRREDWLLEQGFNPQAQDSSLMQPDEKQEDPTPAAEPTPTPEMLPRRMVEVEPSYRSSVKEPQPKSNELSGETRTRAPDPGPRKPRAPIPAPVPKPARARLPDPMPPKERAEVRKELEMNPALIAFMPLGFWYSTQVDEDPLSLEQEVTERGYEDAQYFQDYKDLHNAKKKPSVNLFDSSEILSD